MLNDCSSIARAIKTNARASISARSGYFSPFKFMEDDLDLLPNLSD